jgi:mRNA interferase RelE/StbE
VYTVGIKQRARKALARLPDADYRRVLAAIYALADDPRPPGCKKLVDRDGWRIRVGDYRVIYNIDDTALVVTVVEEGHRRDVYR